MGKDNKKDKWSNMNYLERQRKVNEMANFYGVEGLQSPGRPGHGGPESRSMHEVQRDINDAMANGATADYLRYSGNRGLPHANDAGGMYDLHREMKKDHKKHSGGAFNNQSDVYLASQRAFGNWEEDLLSKIGKGSEEEKEPEDKPETPRGMSWNEAVEAGNMSPNIMAAIERQKARGNQSMTANYPDFSDDMYDINDKPYVPIVARKATEQTPTETPATRAQDYLKASVGAVVSTPGATDKAKKTEKVYQGIGGGMQAMDYLASLSPKSMYEQTLQDSLLLG